MQTHFLSQKVITKELLAFYKPVEIFGNCKNCFRFDKNWSCPPRSFDIERFITIFRFSYIIAVDFSLEGYEDRETSIAAYYGFRRRLNKQLLSNENNNYTTLFAGHCDLCDACSKEYNVECVHPESIRYSYESLGFKVSDIMEYYFDKKLQWDGDNSPESLFIVAGVLTDKEYSNSKLRSLSMPVATPV